jgi:DNA-3-methyladenine glycosylase I
VIVRPELVVGADGRARCAWAANDSEYLRYHDEEWGVPLHGDHSLFEKLSLEGFQAGLSWITILKRRPAFREVFHDFDVATVAAMSDTDVTTLMAEPRIIRNRAKISATIANASIVLDLIVDNPGAFDTLMWSFAPATRRRPTSFADIVATTAESTAMSAALRKKGFRFVGPTTMHALMQSTGMVDDHLQGCWRGAEP